MSASTVWEGFWEQHGMGRQEMLDLQLELRDGQVSGQGRDIIGPFTFQGTYRSDGAIHMAKRYLGQHVVAYVGTYDGEGGIAGRWSIGDHDSGRFALRLVNRPPAPDTPMRTWE